jgi:cyclic pyranopterin phosphate synthase
MPLDAQGLWQQDKVLVAADILAMLEKGIGPLDPIPDPDPRAPALEYAFRDGIGRIGFIASVSRPFCLNCNRIRLTADGNLRYCLFAIEETDVKAMLRSGADETAIMDTVRAVIKGKWAGHEINRGGFVPPPRPMYAIGG